MILSYSNNKAITSNNIELHLPHQHSAQNYNINNQSINSMIEYSINQSHFVKSASANSLPTISSIIQDPSQSDFSMEINDTESEVIIASSSEDLIMEDEINNEDLGLMPEYLRAHSQNQPYYYKQHRSLRNNNHRISTISRTASKPIDIRKPKGSSEFVEQASKLYYNTAPSHFKPETPFHTAQFKQNNKRQNTAQFNGSPLIFNANPFPLQYAKPAVVQPSTETSEEEKSTLNSNNNLKNFAKHRLQYMQYQQCQTTLKKLKNFSNENLNSFKPCMLEEFNYTETDDSIECDKENNEQKTNNIKEAKTNNKNLAKNDCISEGNSVSNCDDEIFDDDGSIFSCDEENNSLNGEISGKKNLSSLNFWEKNSDGFPTPTHFFSIGDIIGYSKVVRAERNEALGQLNDAIGRFSTEWPTIRKDWELNLQRIGQFHD